MAPCKPTIAAKLTRKSVTSESNKVVKRPARGYHRYKNGQLNVTPKGDEKAIVKLNQNSPLLRLPPEIRNRIWEYTLGHTVFRAHCKRHVRLRRQRLASFASPADEPRIGVSLLRTCRQIYAEAAAMPISQNIFAFEYPQYFVKAVRQLKAYQRRQINTMRFEHSGLSKSEWQYIRQKAYLRTICPTAKRFQCIEFRPARLRPSVALETVENIEGRIRKEHGLFLDAIGMSLTVEVVDATMPGSILSAYRTGCW